MRLEPTDIADLQPVIAATVAAVLDRLAPADAHLGRDRLAYPEAEAAALLGVRPHVLRDCRLRGEIAARKVGAKWVYPRDVLVAWLRERGGA